MTKEITYGTIIFATLMGLIVGFFVMVILDSYTSKKERGYTLRLLHSLLFS